MEREFLSFGTNVDISDGDIWSDQLDELYKLPHFLRVRHSLTYAVCFSVLWFSSYVQSSSNLVITQLNSYIVA